MLMPDNSVTLALHGKVMALHTISGSRKYFCHAHHRDGRKTKSQWTITEAQEIAVFGDAVANDWLVDTIGWGLYLEDGKVAYLGVSGDGKRRLFVAKFWDSYSKDEWHGFPADQRKSQDKPPWEIANKWVEENYIGLPKVRKLMKGQRCAP